MKICCKISLIQYFNIIIEQAEEDELPELILNYLKDLRENAKRNL